MGNPAALSRVIVIVTVVIYAVQLSSCVVVVDEYYPDERDALIHIRDYFNSSSNLHANWTGPPCYRNQSRWAGIGCSNWHVTRLVLEGINLTGSLPPTLLHNITFLTKLSLRNNSLYGTLPSLINLDHLEFMFVSHNNFTGSIPSEYAQLPKLTKLELQHNYLDGPIPPFDQQTLKAFNVSYNHLQGLIPQTTVLQSFPESSYDHNSDLCGAPLAIPCPLSPPPAVPPNTPSPSPIPSGNKGKRDLQVWSIVLIAAAAALVPFLVMLLFLCYYRRFLGKKAKGEQPGGDSKEGVEKKPHWSRSTEDPERTVELEFFNKDRPVFDLDDLLRASAEVLGKGKLGTTYKAMLESGHVVAVKRLKQMNTLSKKEFIQQMQLLGKTRHENLVEIISFYHSKEEKLVIYDFVPHGSLFELLHENRGIGRVAVSWSTRLSIIKDVAKGLTFLHQSLPSHKVPHANLKSSNVLIQRHNQNYQAKLTDYGFLPLLPSRKSSEKLAIAKSPEFSQGKKLTHKADVYCFGIILLEMITGKIPGEIEGSGSDVVEHNNDLSDWVRRVVDNDWSTDILDMEILSSQEGHDEMLKLTELALQCTDMAPEKRPKMCRVLRRVQEFEATSHDQQRES